MTTSILCLTVIVYFLSNTKNVWKRITGANGTNEVRYRYKKGVLTIDLHNQGRGGNTM
jgi:hypothetical protein